MKTPRMLGLTILAVALSVAPAVAQEDQNWSFDSVDAIDLDGVSGNLEVVVASDGRVGLRLEQDVRPAGAFRAEVEQSGATVRIREQWDRGSSRGRVHWVLSVPAGVQPRIAMETASGGVYADGVTAHWNIDTASGDFELRNGTMLTGSDISTASGNLELTTVTVGDGVEMSTASGDVRISSVTAGRAFEFSTASGNVTVRNSQGVLSASSASGDVDVYDSSLSGPSEFSSASGSVTATLSSRPAHDLALSSASGNVDLRVSDLGDNFTLVMIKRQDRGRIVSPFAFTSEDTFERNGRTYERKTVTRGSGGPEIKLSTASGDVALRQER